ncbi:MAG: hypothetical protein SFU25_03080 [Candidatus Caenarcaniphilales bacterium]|nr:hypothetical protein [Candidatus Caenarcaniphilales bacterium]
MVLKAISVQNHTPLTSRRYTLNFFTKTVIRTTALAAAAEILLIGCNSKPIVTEPSDKSSQIQQRIIPVEHPLKKYLNREPTKEEYETYCTNLLKSYGSNDLRELILEPIGSFVSGYTNNKELPAFTFLTQLSPNGPVLNATIKVQIANAGKVKALSEALNKDLQTAYAASLILRLYHGCNEKFPNDEKYLSFVHYSQEFLINNPALLHLMEAKTIEIYDKNGNLIFSVNPSSNKFKTQPPLK